MTEKASSKAIRDLPQEEVPQAVSRRNFIKGVITSGVAVSSASYLFRASSVLDGQQSAAGVGERLITLNVNGQQRRVDVMKQETLAWTLRYKLGLTGTKLGCDRAECGSCTVLVDDVPLYSCSVLTHTVRGRKVMTIEGLASADGTLHPVQQGVIDEQGFQCAFCMSGFIMTAVGYLKTNPHPTRQELAHGISGNLCRCQDYDKILTALMRGADNMRRSYTWITKRSLRPTNAAQREYGVGYKLIGKNYETADLYAKVTGKAKYAEDFRADGMLFCKLLLSPMPHARVTRIDAQGSARPARRQSHSHRGRPSLPGRYPDRQWNRDQGQQVGRTRSHHGAGVSRRTDSGSGRSRRTYRRGSH